MSTCCIQIKFHISFCKRFRILFQGLVYQNLTEEFNILHYPQKLHI